MPTERQQEPIRLEEQAAKQIVLETADAEFLSQSLKFDVVLTTSPPASDQAAATASRSFLVNPRQYVGHFALPSGTIVVIQPKIPAANVFRMLAYVYSGGDRQIFREAEVLYTNDTFLFEPLVELFNKLIANRARRGLVQDYIKHEDNLNVLRGSIDIAAHVRNNVVHRRSRIYCRYFENTFDIEDNQIIKWTLRFLTRQFPGWTKQTAQQLRANLHQFEAVTLQQPDRSVFGRRHYHRLNDDYRLIHNLCRLFLDKGSVSERPGKVPFQGFLLDMNQLFERFVTQAFVYAAKVVGLSALPQHPGLRLSDKLSDYAVTIIPDVLICRGDEVISIIDAKYKRTVGIFENHDFYQMLSYGTALNCRKTYLFFPSTEDITEGNISVQHSPITITIRRVDIESSRCVELVEQAACRVLENLAVGDYVWQSAGD